MFEVAWSELLLVLIVAIIVVGPKELPGLMRTAGRMLGKLRRTADEFRKQFDEAVKEAGGEDLQREIHSLRRNNPLNQIRSSIEEAARDSYSPRTGTLPASAVEDEAAPSLPAPPQSEDGAPGAAAETASVTHVENPALSAAAQPKPETETAPPAPGKDLSDDGPGPETRVNGEHRPVN